MGDRKRNAVFAAFIFRNFPAKRYRSVLVVADGKGELARRLASKYKVRVIEAKPRQSHFRKRVSYTRGWFDSTSIVEEDFIVGMHPDHATAEIIKAGARLGKRWAIVPCCLCGIEAHGVKKFEGWIKKLKSLSHKPAFETKLRMNGKNVVLWI